MLHNIKYSSCIPFKIFQRKKSRYTIFNGTKKRNENHLLICTQSAGIIYKFDNKYLISFESNYRYLADLSFVIYFNFEITAGKD